MRRTATAAPPTGRAADDPRKSASTTILDVGFEERGDPDGPVVVLLHGWPDDVRTWDGLTPALVDAGFRVIAPYLRGCGPTRFRSGTTQRSGQMTALTVDLIELMDVLGIESFTVVGHDWGARIAYLAAALYPERVRRCVALSVGFGTNSADQELSLQQTQNYWYHWLFALPRGERLVRDQRAELTRYIQRIWSPEDDVEQAFAATAPSFDSPDWADVTLHSYRVRWGLAAGDPTYDSIEAAASAATVVTVPTLVLHGGDDRCNHPDTSAGREELFTAGYRRVVFPDVGHFPQRTAPQRVSAEILDFLGADG